MTQVFNLRFMLQILNLGQRVLSTKMVKHIKSSTELLEERKAMEYIDLIALFSKDLEIGVAYFA